MDAHTRVITFIIKMTHTRASKNKNKNRQPKCGLEKIKRRWVWPRLPFTQQQKTLCN